MKNIIFFCAIFMSLDSQAQYNFKPADSSAQWVGHHLIQTSTWGPVVDTVSAWVKIYSNSVNYDTIIGTNTYTKLYCIHNSNPVDPNQNDTSYYCSFRSDIAERAIYMIPPDSTNEYLYFDFDATINVDDTILIPALKVNDGQNLPWSEMPFVVDEFRLFNIGVFQIDGNDYKTWAFNGNEGNFYITERVVSRYALPFMYLYGNTSFSTTRRLKCYYENDIEVFGTDCPFTLQDVVALSTNKIDKYGKDKIIDIYPNPNDGIFRLSHNFEEISELTIYDLQGQIILLKSVEKESDINLTNIVSGIYILELKNSSGFFTEKVIIR